MTADLVRAILLAASLAFHADPAIVDGIARCESNYDAAAVSPDVLYLGLAQLGPVGGRGKLTVFYQQGGTDPLDAEQSAQFLAEQIAAGEIWAWPVCGRRALRLLEIPQ